MSDPLYRSPEPFNPPGDSGYLHALVRRRQLKLVSGGVALALIAGIWLVWFLR